MALELKQIDKQTYTDFCQETKTVFNRIDWLDNYSSNMIFCGIVDNGNRMVAAFYYYSDKMFGLPYLHCPPYSPYNGFITKLSSKNFAGSQGELKRIMSVIATYFDKLATKSIIKIAFPPECVDMQPFVWQKFKVIPNYTYRISLNQTIDEISAKMTTERRNDIKKAIKEGVTVEKCIDHNIVKELIEKTFDRKSMSINQHYLQKILFEYANKENSFAFVSYMNGDPIACVFCIFDHQTAYYLMGGYDNTKKHSGAGALALWNAIQHSKTMNLDIFDFEGSMIVPVEKYFRGFGGDITPYYVINKANILLELGLKFMKRELY
jgi:lipid II:glycine glycyltransferase (peptidoglycan interpeptide bridge formation enzyme)